MAWIALLVASTVVVPLHLGPPDMMFLGGAGVLALIGARYWLPMRPAHLLARPGDVREPEFHLTADRLIVALPCDIQLTGFFDGGP